MEIPSAAAGDSYDQGCSILAAALRRLLQESGEPGTVAGFDVDGWLAKWMHAASPDLGDKTPAQALHALGGLDDVLRVLERTRGGLAA